jgi:Ca2+-binding EF-hand superfamily protein
MAETSSIDTKQQQQGHFKQVEQEEEEEEEESTTTTTTSTILSTGELDEIRSAFRLLDVQNTGRLPVADFINILRGLINPDNNSTAADTAAVQQLIDRLERSISSSSSSEQERFVSLDEFTKLLTTPHPNDLRDAVAQVFDLFDTERKGYISLDNLRSIAVELGEEDSCSESFLRQMMGEQDQVSLEDFRSILLSEKSSSTTTSGRRNIA